MSIDQRKADHIRINLEEDVRFPTLTTGLEKFRFVHQALPELNLEEVDTTVSLFGKVLATPLLVSSMTGGTTEAARINRHLAEAAESRQVAIGVGSQRAGIEQLDAAATFRVRNVAPSVLLFANLGAVQLNYGYAIEQCRRAVDMIDADALILHLNPLQEVVQAGGDTKWRGLLAKIGQICEQLDRPVIIKEVGWGISEQVARHLIEVGVSAIDVAGAGGTSWSQVEMHRAPTERLRRLAAAFGDWGIPTAESLADVAALRRHMDRPDLAIFASGGIRSGQDIAKCVALGAELVGLASPFLKRAVTSTAAVAEEMDLLRDELRITMFCCGAQNLHALREPERLQRTATPYGQTI
ncbi:MAG: type 2 isopentenyl-diphosphate Delta-isomerase [Caldilineaceae bacterium]|nr:type 2 isopentenyl-diphosphate Delta-isomerase [Caldilineaceae bacterium]